MVVIVIVPLVEVVTEVRLVEESTEGTASVVMAVFLNESDDLTRGHGRGSHKSQHVRGIDGHNLDLILGQGSLKLFEFGDTARSFADFRQSMQFSGFSLLDRASIPEIFIVSIFWTAVGSGFHGDDGNTTRPHS